MSTTPKAPAASKAAGLKVSVLSRSPSGLGLHRSFSSPFSSPRKAASPSILRRKASTPTNRTPQGQSGEAQLPSLPAVVQPEEKDVQSIVLSPRWQQPPSLLERKASQPPKPPRAPVSREGTPSKAKATKGRSRKTAWSGRVFVKFKVEEEEEIEPKVTLSHVLSQKRKREAYDAPQKQNDDVHEQFSSNVSHVLLAMAELKDEEEDVVSPVEAPQVDLVSQLLLQAENSKAEAQQGTTSDAAITPSPTLNGTAGSDASNDTSLLDLRGRKPTDAEATTQALLESALQAPVSPGITIA